jgi:hypothetical protein
MGVGGAALPCRAVGLNRGGGGRLTDGAASQWRAAAVESVEKKEIPIRLNSNDFKLFPTLTAHKMPFLSSKNLK